MGSLFGGGSSSTQTTSSQPWAPQASALEGAFGQASNIEQSRLNQGPYSGNYVAGQNGYQQQANALGGLVTPSEVQTGSYMLGDGNDVAEASIGGMMNNANGLEAQGLGTTANPALMAELEGYGTGSGGGLSSALNTAAINGTNSLNTAQGNLGQVASTALSDPTQRLEADAQSYANSPETQASVNSTNASINSTLAGSTLPQMERSQAAGGDLNSSRSGAASAAAAGAAATAEGSADATIKDNAYNTGLSSALSSYENGLSSATAASADSANIGNATASNTAALQTAAANEGLSSALGYAQDNASDQLAANAQLGTAGSLGTYLASAGDSIANGGVGLGETVGGDQYTSDQNATTNAPRSIHRRQHLRPERPRELPERHPRQLRQHVDLERLHDAEQSDP